MNHKRGQVREFDPEKGLHQHKAEHFQLKYTEIQCADMIAKLGKLTQRTRDLAPVRLGNYALSRKAAEKPDDPEHKLESAVMVNWGSSDGTGNAAHFSSSCGSIPFCQLRIQAPGQRELNRDWGRIDLVGIHRRTSQPVLIELKQEKAADPLLRVLCEVLAYGIAVEKSWSEGGLRESWNKELGTETDEQLSPLQLVCAAPHEYWRRMLGLDGLRGRMPLKAWPKFWELVAKIRRNCGFQFEFVTIDIGRSRSSIQPEIQGAATLPLKELSLGLAELSKL